MEPLYKKEKPPELGGFLVGKLKRDYLPIVNLFSAVLSPLCIFTM